MYILVLTFVSFSLALIGATHHEIQPLGDPTNQCVSGFDGIPSQRCEMQGVNASGSVLTGSSFFDFFWCATGNTSQCNLQNAYVTVSSGNGCDQYFSRSSGMYRLSDSAVLYTVTNADASLTFNVAIVCKPEGKPDEVTCPAFYNVSAGVWNVTLRSLNACPNATVAPITPPPTQPPIPTPTSTPSNVPTTAPTIAPGVSCPSFFSTLSPVTCEMSGYDVATNGTQRLIVSTNWCYASKSDICPSVNSTYASILSGDDCISYPTWGSGIDSFSYFLKNASNSVLSFSVLCNPDDTKRVRCSSSFTYNSTGIYISMYHASACSATSSPAPSTSSPAPSTSSPAPSTSSPAPSTTPAPTTPSASGPVIRMTLNSSLEQFNSTSFVSLVAVSVNVSKTRVSIVKVTAGSIIVEFQFLAPTNSSEVTVTQATNLFVQLADSNTSLRNELAVIGQVTVLSPPTPAPTGSPSSSQAKYIIIGVAVGSGCLALGLLLLYIQRKRRLRSSSYVSMADYGSIVNQDYGPPHV